MNDTLWSLIEGSVGGAVAFGLGGLLGLLLVKAVGGWYRATDDEPVSFTTGVVITAFSACAAVGLWWWEIGQAGQLPAALRTDPGVALRAQLLPRYLAHVVLCWLLAAATWIDYRQRVIPDWITLPGALLGLVCLWAWPLSLLPIAVEIPRSFATPSLEADVLAWYGPLHVAGGGQFGSAPHAAGLALAAAIFGLWWTICTEPPQEGVPVRWLTLRNLLLVCGLVGILAAWWNGGERFGSLQSALVGLGVSGGLVWATRAGASHALAREAMGLGDVTLMAMVGAWLGWQACVLAFFMAAFLGLAHGVVQFIHRRDNELPFGPSLCLASALVVVAWSRVWGAVAVHFDEPVQLAIVVAIVLMLTAASLFVWRRLRQTS